MPAGKARSTADTTHRYPAGMTPRRLLIPAIALLAAGAAWWFGAHPGAVTIPAATWRIGKGTEVKQGQNYDELAAETPFRLAFACDETRHVYVFSHNPQDGTVQLFPCAELRSDLTQPLPPGRPVLPGQRDGRELAWTTRSQILPLTTFVAIAAREPVPELEQLASHLRRWSTSVLADGSMQVTKPGTGASSEVQGKPGEPWASPLLQAAADMFTSESLVNGPMQPMAGRAGVWCTAWRVKEKPGTAKPFDPQNPLLPEALKALQANPAPPDRR